ncbi:hypothetical protein FXO38_13984 [Capsicum annuum]|nr:hypothetical protein FXO38_13984 [Capsicum annuum]
MALIITLTGFLGQSNTSLSWASRRNLGYLFLPTISMERPSSGSVGCLAITNFFDWKHFKEKLALDFRKQTYAVSSGGCANYQYSSFATEDRGEIFISVSAGIASRLAEANSSPVDNVEVHLDLLETFINEHSSHVDNMFDEMSTGVFTEEVEETSSASILVGDLDDIQSTKVLDESVHSCCHKVIAEVQSDTPIKMFDEAALCLEHRSSSKQKIEFETFDDMYLADFFMEPETEYLSLDKVVMGNGDDIPTSEIPVDKVIHDVERGKSTVEFSGHNILYQFSFNPSVNFLSLFIRLQQTFVYGIQV